MKKILLDRGKNFYKANLHCHSTLSDGKLTIEQIKEWYKSNGYSIIAYTDHEHLIDNSHLNDDNFLAITSCELAIKEFEGVSTLKKLDMKVCHLNLYAKQADNIRTPCYSYKADHFVKDSVKELIYQPREDYRRVYSADGINEIIKIANKRGFLVAYNHPRWSLENATDYLAYKNLWAVEIYNNECNESGLYEYDINTYDDFLRNGQKVACLANDDNHRMESTCGGWNMINAEKLEYSAIISAMEKRRFYASTGPIIHELYIEDNEAVIVYERGDFAVMSTNGRRVEKCMAKNPDGENIARFKLMPDKEVYVRFDIVDKFGKRANTCAYFMDEIIRADQ